MTLNGVLQDERLNPEGKTLDSEATSKLIDRIADLEHRRQVHFQVAGAVRDQVIRERVEAGHFKPLEESQGAPMLGDSVFRQVLEHEQHGRILVEVDPQVDGRIEMYQGLEQDLRAEAELELYRFFNELPEAITPTNADSEVAASSHSQVPNPEIP